MPTPPPATPPQSLSHALALKIRRTIEERGWSQREFARRLGITQGAVSYLLAEKRRASVLDYYERLAQVIGVRLSVLIAELEQWMDASQPGPVLPVQRQDIIEAFQRDRGTAQTIGAILDAVLAAMQTSGGVAVVGPARPAPPARSVSGADKKRAQPTRKRAAGKRTSSKKALRRSAPADTESDEDVGPAAGGGLRHAG